MQNIKSWINKTFNFIIKNKLSILLVTLLSLTIIVEICTYIKSEKPDFNNLILNIIKYTTFILAIEQFRLYKNEYKTSNQHLEKKESVDQARYYEEIIMPLINKITSNYQHQNLKDLNKCFIDTKVQSFTYEECSCILSKEDISMDAYKSMYQEIIQKPSFLQSYAHNIYRLDPSELNKRNLDIVNLYDLFEKDKKDKGRNSTELNVKFEEFYEEEAQDIFIKNANPSIVKDMKKEDIEKLNKIVISGLMKIFNEELNETINKLIHSYHNNISNVLNKLEYFSMNFNSGIADEGLVYQSLHQTFRSTVENLYYFIVVRNKDSKNKYYTHIIELYNKWNDRYLDKVKSEEEIKQEQLDKSEKLTHTYTKKERA